MPGGGLRPARHTSLANVLLWPVCFSGQNILHNNLMLGFSVKAEDLAPLVLFSTRAEDWLPPWMGHALGFPPSPPHPDTYPSRFIDFTILVVPCSSLFTFCSSSENCDVHIYSLAATELSKFKQHSNLREGKAKLQTLIPDLSLFHFAYTFPPLSSFMITNSRKSFS